MNPRYYVLNDARQAVPCDMLTWARAMEVTATRIVERTVVGDAEVSTVFLGLDHQFGDGSPLLFETLVFGGRLDGEMERYSTWDEAVAGHRRMVERVAQ
jgi:hypothetical protein